MQRIPRGGCQTFRSVSKQLDFISSRCTRCLFNLLHMYMYVRSPVDVVDDVGLKQKIASRHQVVHDEVLIGPHRDGVTDAQ